MWICEIHHISVSTLVTDEAFFFFFFSISWFRFRVRLIKSALQSYCNQTLGMKMLLAHRTSLDWFHPSSSNSPSLPVLPAHPPFVCASWQRAMSLVSPLLGSDYSVDCSASTCYCLLSGDMFRRAVFSTTLPTRDGLAQPSFLEYQCLLLLLLLLRRRLVLCLLYLFPPAPLRPLLYLRDTPGALAHSCIFLEIKLTWAGVPVRDTERPTASATLGYDESVWSWEIIRLSWSLSRSYNARVHGHTRRTRGSCMRPSDSQISQSAGLSLAGCSKGACGPKKYWLWGYHGNSLPRGVGCLLNCALVC